MRRRFVSKGLILVWLFWTLIAGCQDSAGGAYAARIASPRQLIGGPGALGAVGDYLLGNDQLRVIIQDKGWSRGFGIFGGGIIDADLNRPGANGTSDGGRGRDNFGEFFPALLLQAFDVEDQTARNPETGELEDLSGIEVIRDGSDGGPAIVRTRARGGDFVAMVSHLVDLAVPSRGLRFETDFILYPGARHVEIVGRLINTGTTELALPPQGVALALSSFGAEGELQLPVGDVALFGSGNHVYAPGVVQRRVDADDSRLVQPKPVGFDLRFAVDAAYQSPKVLPALSGLVTDFLATAGGDVSYGIAVGDSDRNYVWLNRDQYEADEHATVSKHAMLVPFLMSAFTGYYYDVPPEVLPAGQAWEYRRYFVVGTGDVGSIRDELYRIRGTSTGEFGGRVVNAVTGQPEPNAWVHIYKDVGYRSPFSQVRVDAAGRFRTRLATDSFLCAAQQRDPACSASPSACTPRCGRYTFAVTAPGRYPWPGRGPEELAQTAFELEAGRGHLARVRLPQAAELLVQVRDTEGRALPAKVSAVSHFDPAYDGLHPREFLFDLSLAERDRATDLSWRGGEEKDHAFIENRWLLPEGFLQAPVRPSACAAPRCAYDIFVSRGPEYDLFVERDVVLHPGQRLHVDAVLNRVVNTENYVSADMHVHAINSLDSSVALSDRVISAAAEGLEVAVATDHNFITDYNPTIASLNLQDWVKGVVGVELTTLEMGHFNAFPLAYNLETPSHFPFVDYCYPEQADKTNGHSFDWVQCSPAQLFGNLRALGTHGPDNTVVQVNHPRDTIMGYFNQYFVNPYTAEAEEPSDDNYNVLGGFLRADSETGQFAVSAFSTDFDALEVFNGKRLEMLHPHRLPDDIDAAALAPFVDTCASFAGDPAEGHQLNGPGEVLLRKGGHVAFPGVVEDWLHMLNNGLRITATGNSDSHSLDAELGSPRTYLFIPPDSDTRGDDTRGDDTPRDTHLGALRDSDIAAAVFSHRAIVTNGPFLEMEVITTPNGDGAAAERWPIGSTVHLVPEGTGGVEVVIQLRVQAAPWVDVDRIDLIANGQVIDRVTVTPAAPEERVRAAFNVSHRFERDTVLVAEAVGNTSLFPVVAPYEQPPVNVSDALKGLLGSLDQTGLFADNDGVSAPDLIQDVTPYALTNPIWLDVDGDGTFDPPGNDPGPGAAVPDCMASTKARTMPKAAQRSVDVGRLLFDPPTPGVVSFYPRADIRRVFNAHAHVH